MKKYIQFALLLTIFMAVLTNCNLGTRSPEEPVNENAPAAPTDLSAARTAFTSIYLRWTDNADNEDNYIVICSTDSDFSTITEQYTYDPGRTYSAFTGLETGRTYYLKVYAVNESGESAAVTADCYLAAPTLYTSDPVENIKAHPLSCRSAILEWDDNSDETDSYVIERSETGDFKNSYIRRYTVNMSDSGSLDKIGNSLECYGDYQNITAGQTYYYRIKAYNLESNHQSNWYNFSPVAVPAEGAYVSEEDQIRILSVGNSGIGFNHFVINWLLQIDALYPEKRIKADFTIRHKGGAPLKSQWQDCIDYPESTWQSAQGILYNAESKGYYDIMLVQQFGLNEMKYNDDDIAVSELEDCRFWKYLNNFKDLADEYETELVLFQYKVNGTSVTQSYQDYYDTVTSYTETAADNLGIKIVNGARGNHRILFEEGHPYKDYGIRMQISDGHPSQNCTYMFACLLYSCLTGRNAADAVWPAGVSSFAVGEFGVSQATADIIESAVWEIHNEYDD